MGRANGGAVARREAAAKTEEIAERAGVAADLPFDPTAADLNRAVAIAPNAKPSVVRPGEGLPLQVDQDALVGQAFGVTNVRLTPIVGNYDTGEIQYYLCMVTGQAVKLARDGETIDKLGKVFFYIAGRITDPTTPDGEGNSVHGSEMMRLIGHASPQTPVIIPDGIRKVPTAAGGHYYTVRPDAEENPAKIDWFE